MKRLLFIFLAVCCFELGHSQTYFTNTGANPVVLAVAWKIQTETFNGTICKGWVTVTPGEKIMSKATGEIWLYKKGDNFTSGKKVLVGVGDFSIKNADMEYIKEQNTSYQWVFCAYRQTGINAGDLVSEKLIDVATLKPVTVSKQ